MAQKQGSAGTLGYSWTVHIAQWLAHQAVVVAVAVRLMLNTIMLVYRIVNVLGDIFSTVQWHYCKSGQWWRSAWQNKQKQTTYFAHLAHSYDIALHNEDYSYYLIMGRDTKKRTTHYSHLCCNCKNIRVLRHYCFTDGTKTFTWLNGWKMNNWIASLSIKFIRKEMTT